MKKKYVNRFWSKVEKTNTCWLWSAYTNEKGYGYFFDGTTMRRVHRIAHELVNGDIPKDTEIDHLCRTRNCVNPEHLEAVSHQVNCQRGIGSLTHCKWGHEFIPENTYIYGVYRTCVICAKRRSAERRLRLKLI